MDLPKCKICLNRHRLGPCHPIRSSNNDGISLVNIAHPITTGKKRLKNKLSKASVETIEIELPDHIIPKPKDPKEAHRLYMKEYMKKKRAERKKK